MKHILPDWRGPMAVALALAGCFAPLRQAPAQGFSALVTPPRFELHGKPGEVLRHVIEITNVSAATSRLSVQTAEWRFAADGSVEFENALADESCRPWTALESRELELGANARRRFRFEITVPRDATEQECRLAILFEGEPEVVGDLALPVAGRIGVIVYVAIGDAAPRLRLLEGVVIESEGLQVPALTVHNEGTAHTRLAGFLRGRDSAGQNIVLVPQNAPVLPGQTRTLVLHPQPAAPGQAPPAPGFPLRVSGWLEWSGSRLDIDEVFHGE
jgi:fimbrial chaperone protein